MGGARGGWGGASVSRSLGVERRQRGRKHQNLGLHERKVWQRRDDFSRFFAQILVFPQLPVGHETNGSQNRSAAAAGHSVHFTHLVEVLVLSMVDMRRAKASATRLPVPPGSSLAVVSSNSSGSTPEPEPKPKLNVPS